MTKVVFAVLKEIWKANTVLNWVSAFARASAKWFYQPVAVLVWGFFPFFAPLLTALCFCAMIPWQDNQDKAESSGGLTQRTGIKFQEKFLLGLKCEYPFCVEEESLLCSLLCSQCCADNTRKWRCGMKEDNYAICFFISPLVVGLDSLLWTLLGQSSVQIGCAKHTVTFGNPCLEGELSNELLLIIIAIFKRQYLLYWAKSNYAPRLETGNTLAVEETAPQQTRSQGRSKGNTSIALSEQTLHNLVQGVNVVT